VGVDRDASMVTALQCHDEVKLCRICVGWLMRRVGDVDVTPTLPAADMAEATRFFQSAGFDVEPYDDGFAFVHHRDQSVLDLDRIEGLDRGANHAGCYIIISETDDWHAGWWPEDSPSRLSMTCRGGCTSSRSPTPVATTSASPERQRRWGQS
jgi:hypothetical protein